MTDAKEPQVDPAEIEEGQQGPFLQAMARQLNHMRAVYSDINRVSVDFLFLTYLTECARLGRFTYGPLSIDCRVVEDLFERTYQRMGPGEIPGPYDDSARRFYRLLSQEVARSGRRRVDELHWLLAFMRCDEGIPARVFGELGITPEEIERFARGEAPAERTQPATREKLYSPEEVADYLGVHVQTVRSWIRSGKLPARRLAGQRALRIKESDLDMVLEPIETEDSAG